MRHYYLTFKILYPLKVHGKVSINKGGEFYQQGKYKEAIETLEKAKIQAEKEFGKEDIRYAASCDNLAGLYNKQGLYAQAESLYLASKSIIEKVLGKIDPLYAASCDNLAGLYYGQGLYEKAEFLYMEAKNIREKDLGKEHHFYASSCNNLANLYHIQGSYDQAESLYLEAKSIIEKIFGNEHPNYSASCNNIANLYLIQGLYDQAEVLYIEAKSIDEKILGKEHPDYALSCNNLAAFYKTRGMYDQAEPLLIESKSIWSRILGREHPDYALACNNLADLYYSKKLYTQADSLFKEASQILIGQTETNFSNLSEKEKGLFLATFKNNFEIYNSFTLKAHPQIPSLTGWLYDNTLAIKGLLFQSTQKIRQTILNSGDAALIQQFKDWQAKKEYLARAATLTLADKQKQGIDEKKLEAEANEMEKQLSAKAANLSGIENPTGLGSDKTRYTWQDVQKTLKEGEVAIELIRARYYDKKWTDSVLYVALIIRPETKDQPEMVVLPNGKEMESDFFEDFGSLVASRNTRSDSLKKSQSTLGEVKDLDNLDIDQIASKEKKSPYTVYWKPLRDALYPSGKPSKVYLSLDGIYHKISLLGLQNPETEEYLLEEIEIHQVGSTKDLVKWQQAKQAKANTPAQAKSDAVLVGYPTYLMGEDTYKDFMATPATSRGNDLGDVLESIYWKPLYGTKKEIESIAPILQAQKVPVQAHLQAKASEELIKRIRFPRILHIATHGAFFEIEEDNREDFLRLSNQENRPVKTSPMLRSGLALAGISNFYQSKERPNTEDGFLTAYEASNLFLDGTELVVLSACETGLGASQNGEGVFGLQRGFQQAGAKTLLMSLWSVADDATQELMTLFYENWLGKNQSKREAFKNAQAEIKKRYIKPYYWAAFVMVGQ